MGTQFEKMKEEKTAVNANPNPLTGEMEFALINAPFMGESIALVPARPAQGAEPAKPESQKHTLSFGPKKIKNGFTILNVKRGNGDLTPYQVGRKYNVPIAISAFKDSVYYSSLPGAVELT